MKSYWGPARAALAAAAAGSLIGACGGGSIGGQRATAPARSASRPAATAKPIDAAVIAGRLKAEGLPIKHEVIFTAKTDPNHLLGRQGGYTSKVEWGSKDHPSGIEVFPSVALVRKRLVLLQTVQGTFVGDGYDYAAGTALLRLSQNLTPAQATKYSADFRQITG